MALLINKSTLQSIIITHSKIATNKIQDEFGTPPYGSISGMQKTALMSKGCLGYAKSPDSISDPSRLQYYLDNCGIIIFPQHVDIVNFSKLPTIKKGYALLNFDSSFSDVYKKIVSETAPPRLCITSLKGVQPHLPYLESVKAVIEEVTLVLPSSSPPTPVAQPAIELDLSHEVDAPVVYDTLFIEHHMVTHNIPFPHDFEHQLPTGVMSDFFASLPRDCDHCVEINYRYAMIQDDAESEEAVVLTLFDRTIDFWRKSRVSNEIIVSHQIVHEAMPSPAAESRSTRPNSVHVEDPVRSSRAPSLFSQSSAKRSVSNIGVKAALHHSTEEPFFPFWHILKRDRTHQYYKRGLDTLTIPKWNDIVRIGSLFKTSVEEDGVSMKDYYTLALQDCPLEVVLDILC